MQRFTSTEANRNLRQAIRTKYAWPGGYPMYCVTSDGGALCMDCARKEYRQIAAARHTGDFMGGWHVAGVDVNYEDASLYCDHCSQRIESAYYPGQCPECGAITDGEPCNHGSE